ncbi:MAG: hypothetical protein DRQ62_03475 [Gammaproteobacteria bacterium]|nr:MAG: hypothetical protein DRQ62_03475 [Gammaproteobacteria bacterium]
MIDRILGVLILFSICTVIQAEDKPELPPFHHVVGVKPSKAIDVPEKFKLGEEGELICATCHGLKDIDKTPVEKVDKDSADFLVGGSYRRITGFCYRCHDEEKNQRENIHVMLDEQGEIKKENCTYCHEEVPDRDKKLKLTELKLRLPIEQVCYGCHLKDPHFNAVEHQVKPAEKEMLERIEKHSKEQNIFVPLSDKQEVLCVSCHTPHQYGVIDPEKPAGKQVLIEDLEQGIEYQEHPWDKVFSADKQARLNEFNQQHKMQVKFSYQRIVQEALLRLPAKDGQLCLVCHDFKD